MEKVVPSTNRTSAVSDLGPESSTVKMDLAESFKIMSNSADVTDGMLESDTPAMDAVGNRKSVEDAVKKFNRRLLRRIVVIILPLLLLSMLDSS